jgi:hypothetical protein
MHRIPLLAAAAALVAGPLSAQKVDDSFAWTGPIAAGRTLEVRGVNGNLEVRLATGDGAAVRARKTAKRSDLASVEIRVEQHAGGVTICAVYPNSHGSGCTAGHKEQDGDRDHEHDQNDVQVDFVVDVPAGVKFEGGTVNGTVVARGLRSDAEVATVNGAVELETTGTGSATTVNGGVRLRIGKASWTGTLDARTVNGRVEVTMPTPTDLEVEASTLNGSISSEFPLTLQGKMSPRKLRGTIGKGGRRLHLETVNGDVELRKAG